MQRRGLSQTELYWVKRNEAKSTFRVAVALPGSRPMVTFPTWPRRSPSLSLGTKGLQAQTRFPIFWEPCCDGLYGGNRCPGPSCLAGVGGGLPLTVRWWVGYQTKAVLRAVKTDLIQGYCNRGKETSVQNQA